MARSVHATCHCGAISIALATAPAEIVACNCSLCRSYGVVWAYYAAGEVEVPSGIATDTYAWNGRHVDFHHCRSCGCVTHWMPRDATRDKRGVNSNLIPPALLEGTRRRHRDGADTGEMLD